MTEGALFVTGGAFLAGSYISMVVDYIETDKALDKGLVEVGPIASKVVKKWGVKALPLFTFLSAVGVTLIAGGFGTVSGEFFVAYTAPLFVGLTVNAVRNLIKFA